MFNVVCIRLLTFACLTPVHMCISHPPSDSMSNTESGVVRRVDKYGMRLTQNTKQNVQYLELADDISIDAPVAEAVSSRRASTDMMRQGNMSHVGLSKMEGTLFSRFLSFAAHPVHSVFEFDWAAVQHLEVLWCCLALVPLGILHAAAGIGGGGVYVVILMLISKLEPYDAVPLSKAVIFIGAVTYSLATWVYETFMVHQRGKHVPNTIDGVACSVVIPMTLCGTSWGVYFNRFAPDYVIVGGLNVVLLIMTCVVLWQAVKQRTAEDQAAEANIGSKAISASPQGPISASPQDPDGISEVAPRRKEHAVESVTNRQLVVGVILLFLIILSSVAYYRYDACVGGVAEDCTRFPLQFMGQSDLMKHSLKWALPMPLLMCAKAGTYGGLQAYRHHDWSIGAVAAYLATGFGTGIVSGLVGVGGGLIFSPFFVITGMDPAVAVGTSSLCVLFTSASTTFSYLLTDRVITSLALVFGLALAPASVVGAAIVQYLQHIPRSKSYITFIVAIGIFVSLVCSSLKMGMMVQKFEQARAN